MSPLGLVPLGQLDGDQVISVGGNCANHTLDFWCLLCLLLGIVGLNVLSCHVHGLVISYEL
jgi:hypothetical protein